MSKIEEERVNHKMGIVMGNLLKTGVIVAASIVLFGGIIYLFRHGLAQADYNTFQRVPYDLCNVRGILKSVFSFHGRGFIQLGLLLLIATPIARVLLSIFAFALKRDTLYLMITCVVFGILIYSLLNK